MTEPDKVYYFLGGLPEDLMNQVKPSAVAIQSAKKTPLSLEEFINVVLALEATTTIQSRVKSHRSNTSTSDRSTSNRSTTIRSTSDAPAKRNSTSLTCHYCNNVGHIRDECRTKKSDEKKGIYRKNVSERSTQPAEEKQSLTVEKPRNEKKKNTSSEPKSDFYCFVCGDLTHGANKCPKRYKKEGRTSSGPTDQ